VYLLKMENVFFPASPFAGSAGKKRGIFPPPFSSQAKAATVSAQVSTFVRIASSEYDVRLTLARLKVTI
jgi:hypothetical protein